MPTPLRKTHPLISLSNNFLIDYATPVNLSIWWNIGSILGLILISQILSGLFLAIFYIPDISLAFSRVVHTTRDISFGWIIRLIHANGASVIFMILYLHMARGLYYFSFDLIETWTIGIILYIIIIATAFIGYVLPWGQIRFWGATVITRLLSAIPYLGNDLVIWVWGGFAIDNPTLTRFFALHFLLPFLIIILVIIHVIFLHQTGSKNPLGLNSIIVKIPIHPYFSNKDLIGFSFLLIILGFITLFYPTLLGDPENFIPANPLATPLHIKPEWYFLWLYAILRSIPNKLGGVISITLAIIILLIYPYNSIQRFPSIAYYPLTQLFFWLLISNILILTWIGGCPVESPYSEIGAFITFLYFTINFILPLSTLLSLDINKFNDSSTNY